jgi:hypothetical protein
MIPFLFEQQSQRYNHHLFLWSCAGAKHCKDIAKQMKIDQFITGYFEKPPYERPDMLIETGITITPDVCYDDDPSDVVSYYGGLVVAPYTKPNPLDEEWIAMNHFLGANSRRFDSRRILMKSINYRLDKNSLIFI